MKFSCEKHLLQEAVSIASRCAATKSPVTALEGLLITANENIRITGYNMKTGIYTSFPADISEKGSVVLSTRLFGEIVRNLPDGIVYISSADDLKVSITCGASDFSIMGTDSHDYPELPVVDRQKYIAFPQNIMASMIKQTIFAVSDNESRPVYMGCLFEIEENTLSIVAVDGYRLALRREYIENGEMENCTFIVPGNALTEVEKLCSGEENIQITVGEKHISFVIGGTVVISRRIEGEFLNYKKSIPASFGTEVEADREQLEKMVSRVSLIIDEHTKYPIQVSFAADRMMIKCRTGIGRGEDECDVKVTGSDDIKIGFNNKYLLDAVRAAPTDKIMIGMNTASSPCVIRPADGSDKFSYMILPVRLRND